MPNVQLSCIHCTHGRALAGSCWFFVCGRLACRARSTSYSLHGRFDVSQSQSERRPWAKEARLVKRLGICRIVEGPCPPARRFLCRASPSPGARLSECGLHCWTCDVLLVLASDVRLGTGSSRFWFVCRCALDRKFLKHKTDDTSPRRNFNSNVLAEKR